MGLSFYGTIVFLHVVSAVLAIGPLFILMPIIRRLHGVSQNMEKVLLSIIRVIIRISKHAGHALVTTGILLIILGPWPWHSSWVVLTILMLALSAYFLATGFSSVLKNFDNPEVNKNDLLIRLNRTSWIYIGLMLAILWLMVQKPLLW